MEAPTTLGTTEVLVAARLLIRGSQLVMTCLLRRRSRFDSSGRKSPFFVFLSILTKRTCQWLPHAFPMTSQVYTSMSAHPWTRQLTLFGRCLTILWVVVCPRHLAVCCLGSGLLADTAAGVHMIASCTCFWACHSAGEFAGSSEGLQPGEGRCQARC